MARSRQDMPPAPRTAPVPRRPTTAALAVLILASLPGWFEREGRAAPPHGKLTQVRVVGNSSIAEEEVLRKLGSRAGRDFDIAQVNKDVESLNKAGWFSGARAEVTPDPKTPGGLILTFTVVEMPILRDVQYLGRSKVRLKDVEQATGLKAGARADHVRNMLAVNQIRRLYEEKGYAMAEVRLLEGGKAGDTRAIFEIFEGPKCRIVDVAFAGNTLVSDATLRTKVRSRPSILGFLGAFRREDIEEDARKLRQYYMSMGYFEVKVSPSIKPGDTLGEKVIEYAIWEGVQFKVRNISFEGNEQIAEATLREGLMLHDGLPFQEEVFNADIKRLQDKYGEIGCIDAMVDVDRKFADQSNQPGVVDLVYRITEGEPYTLGRFLVQGNLRTRDSVIRREAEMAGLVPGEPLNLQRVEMYRQRLANLGYFVADPQQGKPIDIRMINRRSSDQPYGESPAARHGRGDPGPDARPRSRAGP